VAHMTTAAFENQ